MANSRLKRRFTWREIILMIVLVVVLFFGLYFWLVYYPVRDRLAEVEAERQEVLYRKDIATAREAIYDRMQKELEEIMQIPEAERTYMPEYNDNKQQAVLQGKFFEIFTDIRPTITYSTPTERDGVYSRSITFVFEISGVDSQHFDSDYFKVKDVLYKLTHTGFRCQMNALRISPKGGDVADDALTVNCTVVFYEIA